MSFNFMAAVTICRKEIDHGKLGRVDKTQAKENEMKRRLLLGRKVMTNLDSIFKSRDITLSTNVHLVKAMVFPVVM